MKELIFRVNLDETNLILEGLGLLPFARVYALVEKVQQQASEQLKSGSELAAVAATGSPATQPGGSVNGGSNGQ